MGNRILSSLLVLIVLIALTFDSPLLSVGGEAKPAPERPAGEKPPAEVGFEHGQAKDSETAVKVAGVLLRKRQVRIPGPEGEAPRSVPAPPTKAGTFSAARTVGWKESATKEEVVADVARVLKGEAPSAKAIVKESKGDRVTASVAPEQAARVKIHGGGMTWQDEYSLEEYMYVITEIALATTEGAVQMVSVTNFLPEGFLGAKHTKIKIGGQVYGFNVAEQKDENESTWTLAIEAKPAAAPAKGAPPQPAPEEPISVRKSWSLKAYSDNGAKLALDVADYLRTDHKIAAVAAREEGAYTVRFVAEKGAKQLDGSEADTSGLAIPGAGEITHSTDDASLRKPDSIGLFAEVPVETVPATSLWAIIALALLGLSLLSCRKGHSGSLILKR